MTTTLLILALFAISDLYFLRKRKSFKDVAIYCLCMTLVVVGAILYFRNPDTASFVRRLPFGY